MKIVQINYSDIGGGAARAAYRLHKGLLQIGESSKMIVKDKLSNDSEVVAVRQPPTNSIFKKDIQNFINTHRTPLSNTIFSLSYPGVDLSGLNDVASADIINLHWVAYFYQSPTTLKKLFGTRRPVVWTLHDQWAFTGGCHYSAGCENYKSRCENCPQLSDTLYNLPSKVLQDKIDLFYGANLTIVTPSLWLQECARESALFKKCRVEAIPNSLETDIFIPRDKLEAKKKVGIEPNITTLLFGAENGREKRKGFNELLLAIERCKADARFAALLSRKKIKLLLFGNPGEELIKTGLPIHSLGYVNSDTRLADIYSAADVFILPSLEDNLPNTMLESMSCGTPVTAFGVGGMRDLIKDGVTGKLAAHGSTQELGEAILDLVFHEDVLRQMSKNCRMLIQEKYRLDIQANSYLDLYKELIGAQGEGRFREDIQKETVTLGQVVGEDASIGVNFSSIEKQIMKKLQRRRLAGMIDLRGTSRTIYGQSVGSLKKITSSLVHYLKTLLFKR